MGAALLLASGPALAQSGYTVVATVDSGRIGIQDTLELQVEVRGTGFSSVEPPDLSGLNGFQVLRGPSHVQRQSIINGKFTSSVQLEWTLGPERTGRLRIPPLPVSVDGTVIRTSPLDVDVVQGSLATRVPSVDRFGRKRSQEGEVRLVAEVDRDRVHVGEQVTFTLRLLTQLRIRGMSYQTRADFAGFWVEREFDYVDDPPGRIDGKQATVDGESFNEYILARLALFPTASGEIEIDPVNLQMQVRADRSDPFGSFFFDRDRSLFRRTAPLSITVLPLPEEGRPESFTGAVGSYRLEVSTDRTDSVVNDAVSLKVTVSGEGQIRTAGEPVLPALGDFRAFDPTVEETRRFQGGKLTGSRSWEYVLVPLAPGEQSIPPVVFSFFDPEAGGYRTLQSDEVPLRIARGGGPELPPQPGLARREVTQLHRDIAFIKLPTGPVEDRSNPFHRSGAYLALLAMPLMLNAALLAWKMRSDRLQLDVARRRSAGAARSFRRALREAEATLSAAGGAGIHGRLAGALTGLLADRWNRSAAGLTRPEIRQLLEESGVEESLQREVESILDACDEARFAPGDADPEGMRRLVARVAAAGKRLQGLR
jgi:hypothetical protein